MKKKLRSLLLSMVTLLIILLGVMLVSFNESNVTMTSNNVLGIWANSSDNITLIILDNGAGLYTSDYYSKPSKSITWSISDDKFLIVTGAGLITVSYKLKSPDKLEDIFFGNILTKQ